MSTELRLPDVELRAPRRWPPFAYAAYTLSGLAAMLLALQRGVDPTGIILFFLLSAPAIGLALVVVSRTRFYFVGRRGEIRISDERLLFRGRTVIERRAILQAVAFREEKRHVVRLTSRRLRVLDLGVESEEEGERILLALGRSAAQTTTVFPAIPGGFRFRIVMVLQALLGIAGSVGLGMLAARASLPLHPLIVFCLGYFAVIALQVVSTRCQVVVGADGISVRRPLRRERFVAFREIVDLHRRGREVVYQVEGEQRLRRLTLVDRVRGGGTQAQEAALALVQLVTEARRRVLEGPSVAARALLARGGSSRGDWRARIDRLSDDTATFRTAAVPPDALWNVLADPAESAEVRAGAALALRRQLDEPGRARVRLAAETSAAPPLRRVLAAVTDDDEAAIEEALDELAPAAQLRPSSRASR